VPSNSNTKVTLNDCILNNAWQNHIFLWVNNYLQDGADGGLYNDDAPWENNTPIEIVINNSKLTKCGGPVILQMSDSDEAYNANAGTYVTVTNSELWSYVTGTEAWFNAYSAMGAATYAAQLKAISGAISNTAATHYGATASLTTTREGNGETQFMNMVIAALSGDIKYTVDGTLLTDTVDDAVVNGHMSSALATAPLLQSTVDKTAVATNLMGQMGSDPVDKVLDPNTALSFANGYPEFNQDSIENIDTDFFTGDYLNFYWGNITVLMEYFH
jgi:hypothetical protein